LKWVVVLNETATATATATFFSSFSLRKRTEKQKRTHQKIITNLPTLKVVPLVKKH
jgi:hypothetical protein